MPRSPRDFADLSGLGGQSGSTGEAGSPPLFVSSESGSSTRRLRRVQLGKVVRRLHFIPFLGNNEVGGFL